MKVQFVFESTAGVDKMMQMRDRIEQGLKHIVGQDVAVRLGYAKKPSED